MWVIKVSTLKAEIHNMLTKGLIFIYLNVKSFHQEAEKGAG